MQHELAMRYLAEQRSEQLIAEAERHNRAAGSRSVGSAPFTLLGRRVAARLSTLVAAGSELRRPGRRLGV
jgi:hypothetical protein